MVTDLSTVYVVVVSTTNKLWSWPIRGYSWYCVIRSYDGFLVTVFRECKLYVYNQNYIYQQYSHIFLHFHYTMICKYSCAYDAIYTWIKIYNFIPKISLFWMKNLNFPAAQLYLLYKKIIVV